MFGLEGIGQAIAAVFNFWTQTQNADNKEKNHHLKNLVKRERAIEAAEKMFRLVRQYKRCGLTEKQFNYLFNKWEKMFFDNN